MTFLVDRLQEALKPWLSPPTEYKRPKLNGAAAPASRERMRRYAEAALEGERRKLLGMPPESGRNDELYRAGCRLGKWVHHGVLSLDEVEAGLLDACSSNGLIKEDGLKACRHTLVSGLRKAEGDELPVLEDQPHVRANGRVLQKNDCRQIEPVDIKAWPIMESKATHGIVGRIARLATENSEADPIAVIGTTLAYAGAEFGRAQLTRIGDDFHHSRHFNAIVGQSSRARKGTSYGPVRRIFERAEAIRISSQSELPFPSGCKLKISNGPLSSGAGLVFAVRDGSEGGDGRDDGDKGVQDKRLLVVERELGAAFRAFQRSGNNLSMILRMAYDGGTIAPLTKNNRTVATNPHINVVGHITHHELNSLQTGTEIWNGFANRFQWLMARRPKTVAFPKSMPDNEVEDIAQELARVIKLAHDNASRELVLSNSAQVHWANVYAELTRDYPGILGAVTSRQEAHARRLALTYAQLDGAERIEIGHLEAALAFCRYAFDSAVYLFGKTELDPIAQKILEALTTAKDEQLTQTEVSGLFDRHLSKDQLSSVLNDLQARGRITLTIEKTPGAPRKMWRRAS